MKATNIEINVFSGMGIGCSDIDSDIILGLWIVALRPNILVLISIIVIHFKIYNN